MMRNAALIFLSVLLSFSNVEAQLTYSLGVRNAQVASVEAKIGPRPILRLCGGPIPSSIGVPDGGAALAVFQLPDDWLTSPIFGFVVKVGEWKTIASGTGQPPHYRIYSSDGTAHLQGPVSTNSGNGVITLGNVDLVKGDPVVVNSFILRQ